MKVDFSKHRDGLVPAVIQDANTNRVLTLGFMDRRSLKQTKKEGRVIFHPLSGKKKGRAEKQSPRTLYVREILADDESGALLIKALPKKTDSGRSARTGFGEKNKTDDFLFDLERKIRDRKERPKKSSRASRLFARGINQVAKKLGEEAVELVIEAKDEDDALLIGEAADVLYHFLILLAARDIPLTKVFEALRKRRI